MFKVVAEENLPECYIAQRKNPPYVIRHRLFPGCEGSVMISRERIMLWILLRNSQTNEGQEVPGWSGFISVTGTIAKSLTSIDYYPVINHPITEYRTVQECLRYAEEASKEVGQKYVITTFDLGVCMKAYPLVWNNPQKYKNHIILIGTFHLVCAYLKMVGKKMAGSGLSDVLLEAGLTGSGSIQGVLKGKHYERALHCHKTVLESLEMLVVEQFMDERGEAYVFEKLSDSSSSKLQDLIQNPSRMTLEKVSNDQGVSHYLKDYMAYRHSIEDGKYGKAALDPVHK